MVPNAKGTVQDLLDLADVQINGKRPWDLKVHNDRFYRRLIAGGSLAFGEMYMDGWWDCDAPDQLFDKVLSAQLNKKVNKNTRLMLRLLYARIFNLQTRRRAFKVGEHHYDLGNEVYQAMLDKRMIYTCAYWKHAKNLDEAQEAKLDLVCRKLGLKPGDRVLDIGCGWGGFAKFAAEKYGVSVVGVTVSKEQVALGREVCKGLPVELRLQDYRDVNERFDHIVSLGMLEHVGNKNYRTYMKVAERCLKDDGLFLLHTIGSSRSTNPPDPWMVKYIFPNSIVPTAQELAQAVEDIFIIEDWHNFSADYDATLMAWHENFEAHWPTLKNTHDERFHRMWRYFLLCCTGAFRSRTSQLWQVVLSKSGVKNGYVSVR
jgi:cyclopropane-fatty-acyl-phospholipid synthase